jgi:hypothetical protein
MNGRRSLLILLVGLAFLPFADAAQTQETQTETRGRIHRNDGDEEQLQRPPYEVRCGGGDIVSSHDWLMDTLTRFRTSGANAQKEEPSDGSAH